MAAVRAQYDLLHEPSNGPAAPAALRQGLSQAVAAIVTLKDRIDADTLASARELKVLANYAVGYNNIDLNAAQRRGIAAGGRARRRTRAGSTGW